MRNGPGTEWFCSVGQVLVSENGQRWAADVEWRHRLTVVQGAVQGDCNQGLGPETERRVDEEPTAQAGQAEAHEVSREGEQDLISEGFGVGLPKVLVKPLGENCWDQSPLTQHDSQNNRYLLIYLELGNVLPTLAMIDITICSFLLNGPGFRLCRVPNNVTPTSGRNRSAAFPTG